MANAEELLRVARGELGTKESPADSNLQKYGEWYGMNGEPWCAMFVSWCFDQIGALDLIGGKFAYCPYGVETAKKMGIWLDREEKPQPGDVVFYSNASEACHVGIVTQRNGTESVSTIEGNTSTSSNDNGGAVMERTRGYGAVGSNWYILGFARPAWSGSGGTGSNITEVACQVINGDWGNGWNRQQALEGAGYDYEAVQAEVNRLLSGESGDDLESVARSVINGDYGNLPERRERLEAAGYDYDQVQAMVNELVG